MSRRGFGVEIEYISKIGHAELVNLLRRENIVIDNYATGHVRCPNGCYSGWQIKTDGSITVQGDYQYAIELVSPPMFPSNFGELKAVLAIANKYGAVNTSCGLHVHVHSPELYTGNYTSSLVAARIGSEWNKVEQTILSYTPMSRRSNGNCSPGVALNDRYHALNIVPLFEASRRTIEFRSHSATLNYDKIAAWVVLCSKFVDRLVANLPLEQIDPKLSLIVPPKLIRPRGGIEFYLHRPHPVWSIETKQEQQEFIDLKQAWSEMKSTLKLPGIGFLPDFRFPIYGNAMTQLCQELGVRGVYRSFIEDRYDRLTRKFGFFDPANDGGDIFNDDEDDFYNEPLLQVDARS